MSEKSLAQKINQTKACTFGQIVIYQLYKKNRPILVQSMIFGQINHNLSEAQ